MIEAVSTYIRTFCERFGRAWNLFWFPPSDPAVLSLLRPLIGVVALFWHFSYAADLKTFFGPGGVIPPELEQWSANAAYPPATFSYLNLAGSAESLQLLHWLGFAALALFAIGAATRLTVALGLVVVLSYIHRGPMLTSEFEPVLAMVMFYLTLGEILSLFERLPSRASWLFLGGVCGDKFSVDAWLKRRMQQDRAPGTTEVDTASLTSVTIATRLIQVHLAAIYAMSAIAMLGSEAWWSGEAVWWLLARPEEYAYPLSHWVDAHPYLINLWTYCIVGFQLAFPLLVWNRLWRPFMVFLAIPIWGLVALASGLYLYSAIMLITSMSFMTPEVADAIGQRVFARRREGETVTRPEPELARTSA